MRGGLHTCRRRAPVAVLLCLIGASSAVAGTAPCTKLFVPDGTSGNISWHVDDNWDPVGVPGPADVACVYAEGNYQVVVIQPVTVAGLQIDVDKGNPKVRIVATDFTLNGFGYLAGDTKLKVNDGAVLRSDADGVIEVHSNLVIEGGTVEVDVDLYGHLNWWGTGSVTGTLTTHPGSVIEVEDPAMEAHLTVAEGFDNNGEVVFNHLVDQSLAVISGALVNTATGRISTFMTTGSATTVPELRAELVNEGVIDVDGLDLVLTREGSQHVNNEKGSIQVAGAELKIDLGNGIDVPSNFTNYGTTTVAGGGTIRIVGSEGPLDVPSNFTNYGTTTVAGGGTIRVLGTSSGGSSAPITMMNLGFVDIESGGLFELVEAAFVNPAPGWVRGSGTLDVEEATNIDFDGTVSPGLSPGILTIEGDLPEGENARIEVEVGGTAPGTDLDRLDVTKTLSANGSLDVELVGPYHPLGGERYEIMTYDELVGWFSQVSLPALQHLLVWNVDQQEHTLWLETVCQGTQIGVELMPDRDPVSIGYELIYHAITTNHSQVVATNLTISDALPPELIFRPDPSSPECTLVGNTVECARPALDPAAVWDVAIAVEPVVAGAIGNTVWVDAWECDTDAGDDADTAVVQAVAAQPCDANYDLSVNADDLVPAVAHIFGETAAGNPDCRPAGGITADDLAAIIEAGQ